MLYEYNNAKNSLTKIAYATSADNANKSGSLEGTFGMIDTRDGHSQQPRLRQNASSPNDKSEHLQPSTKPTARYMTVGPPRN